MKYFPMVILSMGGFCCVYISALNREAKRPKTPVIVCGSPSITKVFSLDRVRFSLWAENPSLT